MSKTKTKKTIFKDINRRLFGIFLFLLIVFFVSQIYFTSTVGTKSSEIDEIRREKDRLRLENDILLSKIDEELSSEGIEDLAKKYGLTSKKVTKLRPSRENDVAINNN